MPQRSKRNTKSRRATGGSATVSLERLPTHRTRRSVVRTLAQIATDQGFTWTVQPQIDVADWASVANVFDQYRIERIDLQFNLARSDPAEFPTMVLAPDWNDGTVPTTRGFVLDYETSVVHQFSEKERSFRYSFVPKIRVTLPGSLDTAVSAPTWCHTSQDVVWQGLKYFITQYNSTSNPTGLIEVYAKLHLAFKNSR